MPPRTPTQLITVDPSKPAWEQEKPLHNRWHPDIPPVSLLAFLAAAQLPGAAPAAARHVPCIDVGKTTGKRMEFRRQTHNCICPALARATECKHQCAPLVLARTLTLLLCFMDQVAEVTEGQLFRVEALDWTGGQVKDDDSADDIKKVRMGGTGSCSTVQRRYPC